MRISDKIATFLAVSLWSLAICARDQQLCAAEAASEPAAATAQVDQTASGTKLFDSAHAKLVEHGSTSNDDHLGAIGSMVGDAAVQLVAPRVAGMLKQPVTESVPAVLDKFSQPLPPNVIYFRVSQPFLNRYIKHNVFRTSPVKDNVLDTTVIGTSETTGTSKLTLVRNDDKAQIEVRLSGISRATTTGYHSPVWIYGRCSTKFESGKDISVDVGGLHPLPAWTKAHSRSTTTGITPERGQRLENIVERVAWRRVDETRTQAEAITAQRVEARINRELDQAVDEQIAQLKRVMNLLANLPNKSNFDVRSARLSSTGDYLQVAMVDRNSDERQMATPPPATSQPPDIELCVHSAVVLHAITDPDVQRNLQPVLDSAWYKWLLQFSAVALITAPKREIPPYHVAWTPDGQWLKFTWNADGKPTQGDDTPNILAPRLDPIASPQAASP